MVVGGLGGVALGWPWGWALGGVLGGGVAVFALVAILAFKAKAWIAGLFGRRDPTAEPPAQREVRQVTDVQYEIVEKKDDAPR